MISSDGKLLTFRREFNVPVAKLYDAWTNPELLTKWIQYIKVEKMDVREGGEYRWSVPKNEKMFMHGKYRFVHRNEKIVKTWDTKGTCAGNVGKPVEDTVVTLSFTSLGDSKSKLELTHEFLPKEQIDSHHAGWTGMMVDLDELLNSATRKIDPKLEVRITRTMPFPVQRVFDAWTNPEMMNRWFNSRGHTAGKSTSDLKDGGDFTMDYQMKDGEVFRLHGEYLEVVPLKKLRFSWIEDSPSTRVEVDRQFPSEVTVTFKDLGGKTEVSIHHTKISSSSMMKNFEGGWGACMDSMLEELSK